MYGFIILISMERIKQKWGSIGGQTTKKYWIKVRSQYNKNPKCCKECGKPIEYDKQRNNFCSHSCSATFNQKDGKRVCSEQQKQVLSKMYKGIGFGNTIQRRLIPKLKKSCVVCGKIFFVSPSQNYRKFCSRKCSFEGQDYSKCGGIRIGSGRSKSGWYKGVFCNSSYELAWVIFNLEHGFAFKRNTDGFDYEFEGKIHKYYPDFIIAGVYYEIKGYEMPNDKFKWKSFPHKLEILFKNDLKEVLEYVKSKYGNDFIKLYEGNPHNDRLNKCLKCGKPAKNKFCSRKCGGIFLHNISGNGVTG